MAVRWGGPLAYPPCLSKSSQLYGQRSAGLATLGIKDIANESLPSIHRSTQAIIRLAFFVVQRCTDLFSADFPDFTSIADVLTPDTHPLAVPPHFYSLPDGVSVPDAVEFIVGKLRSMNVRQVAVVCHADVYWEGTLERLSEARLPLMVMQQRGERIPANQPLVVLSRPAHIGGQEFDAVIAIGLEQGLVPPRVIGNDALASAVEQQAYREIYLSVTRARYRYMVPIPYGSSPTAVLADANRMGLILDWPVEEAATTE